MRQSVFKVFDFIELALRSQKNHPHPSAVTGEDVADIIDKLRSEYQKGHAAATGAEHA